ncbi:MAG: GNAT family N-acetyltransferase [Bacteroidales bacterium]|nr:GNAT family N-acetyltransferase [Bacteroidales bacterium]
MELQIYPAKTENSITIMEFQLQMALETENIILTPDITMKGVQAVFHDPSKGRYLLAEVGEEIVGSLMVTPEWSDWRNSTILWIQSVYVVPAFRKKGVFRAMYQYLLEEVSNNPEIGGLRLYVDRSNHRAQQVYTAMGMNGEHYQVFEWMKNQ